MKRFILIPAVLACQLGLLLRVALSASCDYCCCNGVDNTSCSGLLQVGQGAGGTRYCGNIGTNTFNFCKSYENPVGCTQSMKTCWQGTVAVSSGVPCAAGPIVNNKYKGKVQRNMCTLSSCD